MQCHAERSKCVRSVQVQSALDMASVDSLSLGVLREAVNLLLVLVHKLELIDTNTFDLFFARPTHGDTKGTKRYIGGIALINQPQNHYHSAVRACINAPCLLALLLSVLARALSYCLSVHDVACIR